MPTDKLFTGQRTTDGERLYYMGARVYDSITGAFISPDSIVPNPMNPQSLNRYSYCLNNPLKYIDPSGHVVGINGFDVRYFEDYITNPEYLSIFGTAHELDAAIHSEEYKTHQQVCNQNPDWATNLEQSSTVYEVILPVSTDSTIQTVEYASESLTYNVDIQETYVTAPVPESNWYLDFNLSVGYVLGLTGGIMTNENETYFYLGFGIVYSPVCRSHIVGILNLLKDGVGVHKEL
jgi:RHS repeat-associated protein